MMGREGKANSRKRLATGIQVGSAAAGLLLLACGAASALDGRIRDGRSQNPQTQDAQSQQPVGEDAQVREAQASPAQAPNADPQTANPAPAAQPSSPLEAVGRWINNSVSSAGAGIGAAWEGTIGGFSGIGGQAGSAAKGAADAATTVAKGAADVAKETAGAVTRLPTSRIASGREKCGVAPNGAPDCRIAAEALCKGKGFNSGTSIDFENVENCPAQVLLAGRGPSERNCPVDYFVTRSLCQ
jgi:hypothetical protein